MPVVALDQEVETTNVTAAEDLRGALTTLLYASTDDIYEAHLSIGGARLKIMTALRKMEKPTHYQTGRGTLCSLDNDASVRTSTADPKAVNCPYCIGMLKARR